MLQRMSVDGDDSNGSGPLVVLLVETLVEAGLVEQPERKEDEDHNKNISPVIERYIFNKTKSHAESC